MNKRRRSAFTILEILLALAIGVMLMAALYFALNLQMRTAQTGRQLTQQNTLVRSLFLRMDNDLNATVNLADPARWRSQAVAASSSSSSSSSGSMATTASTSTSTTTASNGNFIGSTVVLPLGGYNFNGMICDDQHLTVHVSRFPREAFQTSPVASDDSGATDGSDNPNNMGMSGIGASDLRSISYWFEPGKGLCRQEIAQATFDPNQTPLYQYDDQYLIAPEVIDVTFSYFDGSNWQPSWDGTVVNPYSPTGGTGAGDGITPQGSPRAIKILLTFQLPRDELSDDPKAARRTKQYSHVILIQSANGPTPYNSQTAPDLVGGGTTP